LEKLRQIHQIYQKRIDRFLLNLFPNAFKVKFGIPIYAIAIANAILNGIEKMAIVLPRKHAKSTLITFGLVMYFILFRKKKFILIISNTLDQAEHFLERIKYYLQTSKVLALFPSLRGEMTDEQFGDDVYEEGRLKKVWNSRKVRLPTGQYIAVAGAKKSLRGLISIDDRPDLVINDDIEDRKNTNTPELISALLDWFYEVILPIGSDDCQFVNIGTIVNRASLLPTLLKNPEWKSLECEAIMDKNEYISKLKAFDETLDISEVEALETIEWEGQSGMVPIWYTRYSLGYYEHKKRDYEFSNRLPSFYQEYFNRSKSKSSDALAHMKFVDAEFFEAGSYTFMRLLNGKTFPNGSDTCNVKFFGGIDFAYQTNPINDDTAIVILAATPFKQLYVVDGYLGKIGIDDIERKFWDLYFKWEWESFGIDANANQIVMKHLLSQRCGTTSEKGVIYPELDLDPLTSSLRKSVRIEAILTAYWQFLYIFRDLPSRSKLEDQIRELGETTHDDYADALSLALEVVWYPSLVLYEDIHPSESSFRPSRKEKKEVPWYL